MDELILIDEAISIKIVGSEYLPRVGGLVKRCFVKSSTKTKIFAIYVAAVEYVHFSEYLPQHHTLRFWHLRLFVEILLRLIGD